MSGISFLLIVVVISVVGSIFVWLRNRQPNDPLSSVGDFQREMEALGTAPPVVVEGSLEVKPAYRVNTVHVRPNSAGDSDLAPGAGTATTPETDSDADPDDEPGR
ncbi:MAG: hypothetical protein F2520_08470 [Actinobacteria bacterium]|uniref:Unannotated protein n=1 Tax=freshwater metagenome TaxID=449393 RepID=A0A6J7IWI8_9ZZZZ|nr:hypothetical protein [Actinomycetota bacterium]MTA78279.1 hypothetical protein [Actinomycetota bacterium]